MRKSFVRLFSLLMALAMCLSLLGASVWAEESEFPEESTITVQGSEEAETDSSDEKETAQDAQPEEDAPKEKENAATGEAKKETQKAEKSKDKEEDELETQSGYSGSYGTINYSYDPNTKELTIGGTGAIQKMDDENYPWKENTSSYYAWSNYCTKLTIQDGITSIQDNAFSDFVSLREINLPSSLRTIGTSAFANCEELEEISLPVTMKAIGNKAFDSCSNLKKVIIPSSVESIGEKAFYKCSKLAILTLSDGLMSIGKEAFYDCDSLRTATIPDTVTRIDDGAFSSCSVLERVTLPKRLKQISNSLFEYDSSLWSISIPETVEIIGKNSFDNCESIKSLTLPNSLLEIGEYAFVNTGIKNMIFPASVTVINESVFDYCPLDQLVFEGSPPTMWSYSLYVYIGMSNSRHVDVYYPSVYADRWTQATRESLKGDLAWFPYCHMENDTIVTAHSMGQGTVTKEPTYEQPGIRTYTCSYCGYSTTEIIPQLVKDPTPLSECVITLSQQYYIYDGTQKKPTVTVTDNGAVMDSSNYTVTYSANVNAGTATVRITGTNDLTGTATKTFVIAKAEQSMSVELTADEIYAGKSSNVICDGIGTLQYSSSNTSIATVSSSGKITGISKGTASITVLASGDSNHESALESVTITVLPAPMTKAEAEKLYAPVLDMLYYNIKTNWKYYEYSPSVSYIYSTFMTSKSDGKLIGYCFKDINADGTPEMLISAGGAKNNVTVEDLYTCVGGKVYHIASSGQRYFHYLLSDGTLKEESSGGGSTEYYFHYKLKKNGKSPTYLDGLLSDYGKYYSITKAKWSTDCRWSESAEETISKNQFNSILDSWPETVQFNSSLVVKYTPKSKTAVYEIVTSSLSKTTLKSVKAGKSGSIDVTWKKNSNGKGYWVQCSTDKKFIKNVKTKAVKKNGTVKTTIKGLKKGTWYVRVCTKKGYSVSAWSSAKTVKVK